MNDLRELPHTRSCFVCGDTNPVGLNLRFFTDGKKVQAHFRPAAHHAGFRDTVHGGLIATVLDEVMVWACAVQTRRFTYCAELAIRYVQRAIPNMELIAWGELESNRRDRIYITRAELHDDAGTLLASATGKYLPAKTVRPTDMVSDFVGDAGWLFGDDPH